MSFNLPGYWVWDFWCADDSERYHLFYLHAPKSLGDPQLRHRNARIGHATSTDLRNWTNHGQVFDAGAPGSFDGSATWTGSVVKGPDGLWRMFYTGSRFLNPDNFVNVETIGVATSPDLETWTKQPGPICVADPKWYETLGTSSWPEEAFRDPWVFWREHDQLWHMLITARSNEGPDPERGVVGHATSPDLGTWTLQPPLSQSGGGFAHLEVFQTVRVEGSDHLVFCSASTTLSGINAGKMGGVFSMPVGEVPGPIDPRQARLLVDQSLYAGRVVKDRTGAAFLMAFHNDTPDGGFSGGISDPIALQTDADGYLSIQASS
ncbi:hypothetical protein [Devosia sp.]|uniref:hypothetical protein n=1 Tax=Devosia sp. TaxID=1871048 RepID=UPI003A8FB12C